MAKQPIGAVVASIGPAESLLRRPSTQRKKYETKLAAYGYENKLSLERDFAPGDRNPEESKWRSIQFPKVAGSTSHLWAARRFACRVGHCFAATFIRERLCPAAAASLSESDV
jgi:hypothetical protein